MTTVQQRTRRKRPQLSDSLRYSGAMSVIARNVMLAAECHPKETMNLENIPPHAYTKIQGEASGRLLLGVGYRNSRHIRQGRARV